MNVVLLVTLLQYLVQTPGGGLAVHTTVAVVESMEVCEALGKVAAEAAKQDGEAANVNCIPISPAK